MVIGEGGGGIVGRASRLLWLPWPHGEGWGGRKATKLPTYNVLIMPQVYIPLVQLQCIINIIPVCYTHT